MRSIPCLVAVLALVTPTFASVQFFFTDHTMGLTNPDLAFAPCEPGVYAVNTFPTQMADATVQVGETAYVWVKFAAEPDNRTIIGIHLTLSANPVELAYYKICAETFHRWNGGTPPDFPEFKVNPVALIGINADGIQNTVADNPVNLYAGGAYRTALLGAVNFDTPGDYTFSALAVDYSSGPVPATEGAVLHVQPVQELHRGDMNCDGMLNFGDINPFVLALSGQIPYETAYPDCHWLNADCNGDGLVNFADISAFIECALVGGCS